jgi:hypothetical protein
MKVFLALLTWFAMGAADASYVLDCVVTARILEINSSKPYQKEYFAEYDVGEVIELKILEVTNERSDRLKASCQEKLQGKTEMAKLRAPLPKNIKKGDLIKLDYVFSIPRSPQPKTGVSWIIKN